MAKEQTQSQGTRRDPPEKNEKARQGQDGQGQRQNQGGRNQETGGEESKHGRKQKGNVDDT